MTSLDFAKIRSAPKSRNDSFEALAVQLFRTSCSAPVGSGFVSLRGDGGDGGVEAYYRTPTGEVLGVQAKYFFRLGASELNQIDGSLATALSNHPTLTQFWVYVPFDLTGRVSGGTRGTREAERFEAWKSKRESEAAKRGARLSITLCTASTIRTQLLDVDRHGGMRRYWFDGATLTMIQIGQCLDQARTFAGPRYSTALDVVTSAHAGLDFFGGIGDIRSWHDETLSPVLRELLSLKGWGDKALGILGASKASAARGLIEEVKRECEGIANAAAPTCAIKNASRLLSALLLLLAEARDLQERAFYANYGKDRDTPGFRQWHAEYMCAFPAGEMDAARKWEELCQRLQGALSSQELGAAVTRSLLLVGPAGIGKTHAIVSAALRRFSKGGLSLVVFGDDFGKGEPWEVLRSKLGFGASIERDALFECFQACAEHTGKPFLIYIDALNESPREARWKDKLPELITQCKPYTDIKICVSTRDTYRHLVVDSRFPGLAFEHIGFTGQEFEALQAFAAFYELNTEITPLFSPELNNPLFLHLACRTLKAEGRHSLDVTLPGFTALFESHLKHCDELIRGRLQYANPRNLARAAMLCLAETLTHTRPQERTWEGCVSAIQGVVGSELAPEVMLKELEHEGLVILTAGESDTWLVRLGYQRYGDVLRATSLVENCVGNCGLDVARLAKKLAALPKDDDGLLEVLAAVLPEMTGTEVTLPELGLESEHAHRLFVNALAWRSLASIGPNIDEHIYRALGTPGLWQPVYDVFFRLSLVPQHRLNADNWLHDFLQRQSMVDRDAYLSVAAFKSFDGNGAVRTLINAALRADILRWPAASRRLAGITLAWLSSCADRRVRDMAAKGLARIVACQPKLGREFTDEFQDTDDDYVLESISLAIYSACLLERSRRKEFVPALEGLLSPAFDVANVLVRDTVYLLSTVLQDVEITEEVRKRLDAYPRKTTIPEPWPQLADAKPLLDLEYLPSNMELRGRNQKPDFWRYQVEGKINDFDLAGAGINNENIACWLMVETLKLGYPGYQNNALQTDRAISGEFGTGRGRKGYADRLGKKYYWISLHRLLGVLSDNVPTKVSYSGWKPGAGHLWSVDVRKVDLTDVRDISSPREYPDELLQGPRYTFPERAADIKNWVRLEDFTTHENCIIRKSSCDDQWVALALSASDDDRPPGDDSWSDPYLSVDLIYSSILVDEPLLTSGTGSSLRDAFNNQEARCYRGYLAEYPDGAVFDQCTDEGYFCIGSNGMIFTEVTLLRGREWEYDYSSEKAQDNLHVPCQDLVRTMALQWDRQRGWLDSTGTLVAFEAMAKRRSGLFIRRAVLNAYLKRTGRRLIYRRFVNRGLFTHSGSDGSQIDLLTWLLYEPDHNPLVLKEESRPFNC